MKFHTDRYCSHCGKRMSLAEYDLYGGYCNICSIKKI